MPGGTMLRRTMPGDLRVVCSIARRGISGDRVVHRTMPDGLRVVYSIARKGTPGDRRAMSAARRVV